MPSDANGVYSLPTGYLAVTGQTVLASQHNPPLEDVETALTARLPRNGSAAMTGPLQLADGTSSAPAVTFATDTTKGFYKTASGFGATGFIAAVPIGFVGDFAGLTAPAGWLFCFGQSLLRADYLTLYQTLGTTYGSVDGTHFNLPDCRGVVTAGAVNMGGTNRGILTGGTISAFLGVQEVALSIAQMPVHDHDGLTGDPTAGHTHDIGFAPNGQKAGGPGVVTNTPSAAEQFVNPQVQQTGAMTANHKHAIANEGGSTAHTNVQPTLVLNKIIFTGV